jgi:DNA/RNA endonuclease YhcR with UshA esterase domain
VYLRDATTGEFEIFRGTQQVKVRNPRLVAQLLDGIATAQ